jgi:hypothetical protein
MFHKNRCVQMLYGHNTLIKQVWGLQFIILEVNGREIIYQFFFYSSLKMNVMKLMSKIVIDFKEELKNFDWTSTRSKWEQFQLDDDFFSTRKD